MNLKAVSETEPVNFKKDSTDFSDGGQYEQNLLASHCTVAN